MHIRIEGRALREALSKAGPVATRAAGYSAEMYSSAKLKANAYILTITTTHPELQVKQDITATNILQPGTLLVPKEQLARIAKEAETVEIKKKQNQIHISVAGTVFRLNKPAVEPPERGTIEKSRSVRLRGGELKQLLKQTLRFASKDSTRPILNSVLVEIKPQEIRAVAADSHRLSLSTLPRSGGEQAARIAIPPQIAQAILGLAADDEDMEIKIGKNSIEVSGPSYEIRGALLEGEFPDYEKVIPGKNPHAVEIGKKDLLESLQRLKLISDQDYCRVRLSFSAEKLKLDIQNPNLGEATDTLEIEGGEKVPPIGMNVGYLIDALETIGEERVKIGINNANSPMLITGESRNPLIVIMPMRAPLITAF